MHSKMWRSVLLSLYITSVSVLGSDEDDEKTYQFKVNPGGQLLHHQETRNGMSCKFSYQAQGGTNEDWEMKISLNEKREFTCTVERPGGHSSYLFFQSFELKVTGVKPLEGKAFGQNSNPLNADEFSLDFETENEGKIKQIDGKFKSQLQKVYIKALQTTKEEL